MTRVTAIAVSFAAAVGAGPVAHALFEDPPSGAHAIAGVVLITLDAPCPEEYRVPIAGSSEDGSRWRFVLDGAQATCTPRYSTPLIFEGRYNPSALPCDRLRGIGCPRSTDAERPGYLSMGSLPYNAVLQETSVRYCVLAKCYQGRALLDRVRAAPMSTSADPLTGAIAGIGAVTPPGCAAGAMKMPVSAVSDGGPVWLVVRPASVAADCPNPVFGVTNVFVGSWNPNRGGCVASITNPGTTLCMNRIPYALGAASVGMSLCFPGPACWSGRADLVRT